MLSKNNFIFLDLDKTVWNCYDKNGNEIWAKQMIPPYKILDNFTIMDDVSSYCRIDKDFFKFLEFLENKKIEYSFCSNGGIYEVDLKDQPSYKLLQMFNVKINSNIILQYKTKSKKKSIENFSSEHAEKYKLILIDDDENVLSTFTDSQIKVIDRKTFLEWEDICEHLK